MSKKLTEEQKKYAESYWLALDGYIEGCIYFGFSNCMIAVAPIIEEETIKKLESKDYSVSKAFSYEELDPKCRFLMVAWDTKEAERIMTEFDVLFY